MPTNLLVGHAELPYASAAVAATPSAAAGYPVTNLFGGNRTEIFRTASNATNSMTVAVPLAAPASVNFLYVGNANLLRGDAVTTLLLARNTVNAYGGSTAAVSITLASETLYGPQNTDVIRSFAATTAYQYWWFAAAKTGTMTSPFSKLLFGTAFDMGCDPEAETLEVRRFHDHPSQRRPLYRVTMTWQAVTKAKAVAFYNAYALPRRHRPAVLFTASYHAALNGHRVLYGRFTQVTMPPRVTDYNTVTATFEEVA